MSLLFRHTEEDGASARSVGLKTSAIIKIVLKKSISWGKFRNKMGYRVRSSEALLGRRI